KAQLSISTIVHDATHTDITNTNVPLGTVAHDTATVTRTVADTPLPATPSQFDCRPIANDATPAAADSGFTAVSVGTSAVGAGNHKFNATVASNDNHTGASFPAQRSPDLKAQLSISTIVHDATHTDITNTNVPLGTVAHDTATVT